MLKWIVVFGVCIVVTIILSNKYYRQFFKRFYDIFLSGMALLVLSPVFLVLMLLGCIKMKGNPFFAQERIGKNEKVFKLYKFRSMTNERD